MVSWVATPNRATPPRLLPMSGRISEETFHSCGETLQPHLPPLRPHLHPSPPCPLLTFLCWPESCPSPSKTISLISHSWVLRAGEARGGTRAGDILSSALRDGRTVLTKALQSNEVAFCDCPLPTWSQLKLKKGTHLQSRHLHPTL